MKLQLIKKSAIAAALSVVAVGAFAMTPIQDEGLSQVSGQDGVSIGTDLHVKIGKFEYTNVSGGGATMAFNDINLTGAFAATLEVQKSTDFHGAGTGDVFTVLGLTGGADAGTFHTTSDVVKISIPQLTSSNKLNFSVGSVTMGGSANSFGQFAMNDIQLQGTKVYIWAKN